MNMLFLIALSILVVTTSNKFASANNNIYWSILDDIRDLNASCSPKDTCVEPRSSDDLSQFSCQCNGMCSLFGTCCADSQYNFEKQPKVKATCRSPIGTKAVFMVDRCGENEDNSIWKTLCEEEWDQENDVMKLVPVTSVFSRITYKNYFCFRCHEANENYLYWKVNLMSSDYEFDDTIDNSRVSLDYDQTYRTWVAPLGRGGVLVPVNLSFGVPNEIPNLPVLCKPELISHCAQDWIDKDVSDKCAAYMGIVYINRDGDIFSYRNVHCALCNFEDLVNMSCITHRVSAFGAKIPFSFTHLLDVNRADGDEVGKVQRCEENFLWDPYARKCRRLACALPGHVVRNGKCTPP